jgi:hypothetical protein
LPLIVLLVIVRVPSFSMAAPRANTVLPLIVLPAIDSIPGGRGGFRHRSQPGCR